MIKVLWKIAYASGFILGKIRRLFQSKHEVDRKEEKDRNLLCQCIINTKKRIYLFLIKNKYIEYFFMVLRVAYLGESSLEYYKICSLKEWANKKGNKYYLIEESCNRAVNCSAVFEGRESELLEYRSPEVYCSELMNVTVIGASSIILSEEKILNDTLFYDKEHRVNLCNSTLRIVDDGYAIIELRNQKTRYVQGINLVGAASFNYYHLVIEILARLTFIDQCEQYRDWPILVDEVVLNVKQFKEALDIINEYNHPIIIVKSNEECFVEHLVSMSSIVWLPINLYDRYDIRPSDFMIAESVIMNLRKRFNKDFSQYPKRTKCFISRKNVKNPRLSNEEEARTAFEEHGYEIVYTEEMTFREQVRYFSECSCIVGTSGAAMTNILFCQPGTRVVCIIPEEHHFHMYSTIASILALEFITLNAEVIERTPYAAADVMHLDMQYVNRFLEV